MVSRASLTSSRFAFRESHNRVLRDLALLGYLGQLHPPAPKPLQPLHSLTPYQVRAEPAWGSLWLPCAALFRPLCDSSSDPQSRPGVGPGTARWQTGAEDSAAVAELAPGLLPWHSSGSGQRGVLPDPRGGPD